jgi:hypothetical protein
MRWLFVPLCVAICYVCDALSQTAKAITISERRTSASNTSRARVVHHPGSLQNDSIWRLGKGQLMWASIDAQGQPLDAAYTHVKHDAELASVATASYKTAPEATTISKKRVRNVGAVWTEIAAVLYVILWLTTLAIFHQRFHRAGLMRWDTIKWCHVARSVHTCVSPVWMALFRFSFAVYVFVILGMSISNLGVQALATFTMWSWGLIGVYGLVTATVSALEAAGVEMSGKLADALVCGIWVSFQVLTSVAILICVVVWFALVPIEPWLISFVPLSAHNLNVVFMVAELLLNRMPFVRTHAFFPMYYGAAYIIFSWFYCLSTGIVLYFFIDWRTVKALAGYTVLICTMYASFVGCHGLTAWIKTDFFEELPCISDG